MKCDVFIKEKELDTGTQREENVSSSKVRKDAMGDTKWYVLAHPLKD